ncbi:4-hydroxy-tetrahydrodipicolinate synthase [Nocardia camponoti]|uniref:4-hydroxy-tetrahydrodipicolinate synthase n=1 Tax=Nocardia camponoti TaxID=1616106 RepID=A0A917Q7G2_9NOCA|nr:4-hydroxy-tetrahydrodipicolinate synthase [Nocardia camponoti]GGK33098.1 4-hydroxy-tetrahydrodipicolinate synthase [Nocardia camponoti]
MTTLRGLYVPLITPFTETGALDTASLEAHARRMLDSGAAGLVALGTTGEPATLTAAERAEVRTICAEICAERHAQLIVGAGGNATAQSISDIAALSPSVSAVLAVVPYYTRPSEEGVIAHFENLATASEFPLIVYHVPHRTGLTLSGTTLRTIAEIPNVVGFKHAVGGIDNATVELMAAQTSAQVLSGDDRFIAPLLALGAQGAIAAVANLAPATYATMINAWLTGDFATGRALHHQLDPLAKAAFAEPNPTVIKAVLAARNEIATPHVRLPLLPASAEAARTARLAIK